MSAPPGEPTEGEPGDAVPGEEPGEEPGEVPGEGEQAAAQRILSSSAVMAAGTVVSRFSGFLRSALLAAALGTQLHADVFTIANTLPNMLYILLAGGVFNAVLVPQLVRAAQNDPDGGAAYTDRVVTLAALFLAGVTAVLVIGAPWVMRLFLDASFFTPDLAGQRESVIDLARLCLPQVFFYGMFVMVGQLLNARGSFGPMMWAPIANNVLSIAVLGGYLLVFGAARGPGLVSGFSAGEELLLGLGSTLGIAAQLAILVPYLRRAGVRLRPRFDFRGAGLGHTLRLGTWTVLFVAVNQLAYTVVVRIASGGTAEAVSGGGEATGAGYTVYSNAFLVMMVPHAIATVSLATAVLPQLSRSAAEGDLAALGRTVARTLRTALALVVPAAALLPVVARDLSNVIWGYAAAADTYQDFAAALSLFAPGLVLFTSHYLMLRGFYALERTRTVFWVQCLIAGTNIGLALLLAAPADPGETASALVVAYAGAYLVGAVGSYVLLRRVLGGLDTPVLLRFLLRLTLAVAPAAGAGLAVRLVLDAMLPPGSKPTALLALALVAGVAGGMYLLLARVLRIEEVGALTRTVAGRLGR